MKVLQTWRHRADTWGTRKEITSQSASSIISSSLSSWTSSTLASCLAFTFFLLLAKLRLVSTSAISISPSSSSHLLLLLSLHGLPESSSRRLDQGKIPLHLFDVLGLLNLLGHFHSLEDVMCLPLVLDLLDSLHGMD